MTTTTTKTSAPTIEVPAEYLHLGSDNVTVAATAALTDPAALPALLVQIEASIRNTSGALARLGSAARALEQHQAFVFKLQNAFAKGIGDLVDADLGKEGARLRALETRERLGVAALSIANRAPQVLLGLFRNG